MQRGSGRSSGCGVGGGASVAVPGWSAAANDEERLPFALLAVLAGEIAAFAALAASGNMPGVVTVLYRALLTL